MPQVIHIGDLRNTNELSDRCHAKQEPIFVTKNGYGDLVVMGINSKGASRHERHICHEQFLIED